MEIGLVILIQLYRHLVKQTLNVFDIVVVFQLRINLSASDDHVELVQLQSKELSDLVSQVAKSLEVTYLQLPLSFVVHIKTVNYRNDLGFDVVESRSD